MPSYVPILRVKQSEYLSLHALPDDVADDVIPLLYQTPAEDGPERDIVIGRLKKCAAKWDRPAFYDPSLPVDIEGLDPKDLYDEAADLGGYYPCVPVDARRANTAAAAANATGKAAIRVANPMSVLDATLPAELDAAVAALGLPKSAITVVFDLGAASTEAAGRAVAHLPYLDDWESVVLAGGSFTHPEGPQETTLSRDNLDVWRTVEAAISRDITFGDYGTLEATYAMGVAFPPAAKLAYTTPDGWFYVRGNSVRTHPDGNGQMIAICQTVMAHAHWRGAGYSWGDAWIDDVAHGRQNPGNAGMWIRVALTHHVVHVVREDV